MITKQARKWSDDKLDRVIGLARAELAQMRNGQRADGNCIQHEHALLSVIEKLERIKSQRSNGVS
jgi:hypothetical protein